MQTVTCVVGTRGWCGSITHSWQHVGFNLLENQHLRAKDTSEPRLGKVCSLMQEREEFVWDKCYGLTGRLWLAGREQEKKAWSPNDGEARPMQAEAEGLAEQQGACLPACPPACLLTCLPAHLPACTRVGSQQPGAGMLPGAFLGDIQKWFEWSLKQTNKPTNLNKHCALQSVFWILRSFVEIWSLLCFFGQVY